ncbi:hypothetical protein [Cellulosilyticum ruminicola]|uniref:hypothetical protein n=1 Tax=Cellulosilyticum ruminicola TaxID=425254 RepID=UPI0012EDA9CC|nr:hypothetical protein [Cellulosilyticum ruminicola]
MKEEIDIQQLQELVHVIDENLTELYHMGEDFPFIKANVKQMQALIKLVNLECADVD